MATTEPLIEHHVLEYPGGYTRSVGPALSRYFTGLCAGHIVGVRLGDGRVMVPPTEYDPETGHAIDDFVEVGPAGVVEAWTWVAEPVAGKHHLGKPFAFALVRPDGADVPMVHVVDVAGPDELAVGMRVMPRWKAERVGYVTDLEAWVPMADGEQPAAPVASAGGEEEAEPVTGITVPIRLEYEINAGRAPSKYLRGMAEGKLIGQKAVGSDQVYLPPRGSDPTSGAPTEIEVEVSQNGTVTTFCITNIPGLSESAPEVPYIAAQILLDGANTPYLGLVQGIPVDDVRMGLRVRAVWDENLRPDARCLKWFEPNGEPDAAYESYRAYA
ncbi:MAG: Zn-ribbon domain-containing OB-fold protein [Acidimicrobiia bacterium]